MEIGTFVVFQQQIIEVFGWCSLSILLKFFRESRFCRKGFSTLRDFFSFSHIIDNGQRISSIL